MKWVKLIKHYQGGTKTDYMLVEDCRLKNEDSQDELMEEWGENTDGGHAYGYKVEMEILGDGKIPPKEWLEKKVKSLELELVYIRGSIIRTEELIKTLELLLK